MGGQDDITRIDLDIALTGNGNEKLMRYSFPGVRFGLWV